MPVDSHFDVRASICRDFDAIHMLCCSANVVLPEDAIRVFFLNLQSLDAIIDPDFAGAAKPRMLCKSAC